MKPPRNKYYLLNYIFLFCLVTLVVNDHYLKYEYGNWFTGKLSDIVGIILLPLLLTWLFPSLKAKSIILSAALLIFWKSPFSQGFIDFYNRIAIIRTSRVVDYTDLFVLLLLPIPWFLIKRIDSLRALQITRVNPLFILLPTVISLMSTAPPRWYNYTRTNGNLECYNCNFTVHYTQPEIIDMLKKDSILLDTMPPVLAIYAHSEDGYKEYTTYLQELNVHFYRLNSLVIDKDTLRDIEFSMRTYRNKRTKIYFTGMNVSHDISTTDLLSKAAHRYEKLIFKVLKPRLRK
jgi:hypothetical protein